MIGGRGRVAGRDRSLPASRADPTPSGRGDGRRRSDLARRGRGPARFDEPAGSASPKAPSCRSDSERRAASAAEARELVHRPPRHGGRGRRLATAAASSDEYGEQGRTRRRERGTPRLDGVDGAGDGDPRRSAAPRAPRPLHRDQPGADERRAWALLPGRLGAAVPVSTSRGRPLARVRRTLGGRCRPGTRDRPNRRRQAPVDEGGRDRGSRVRLRQA